MREKLDPSHDSTIKALWRTGWDTAGIAIFLEEYRETKWNRDNVHAQFQITEADVYNVLDRALKTLETA